MKLIKQLETKLFLKGAGAPERCLGGGAELAGWGSAAAGKASRACATQVCEKIEKLFEIKLRHYGSPLDLQCRLEAGDAMPLPPLEAPKRQALAGRASWVVTLGHF